MNDSGPRDERLTTSDIAAASRAAEAPVAG